jgi:hypothetical protein
MEVLSDDIINQLSKNELYLINQKVFFQCQKYMYVIGLFEIFTIFSKIRHCFFFQYYITQESVFLNCCSLLSNNFALLSNSEHGGFC